MNGHFHFEFADRADALLFHLFDQDLKRPGRRLAPVVLRNLFGVM